MAKLVHHGGWIWRDIIGEMAGVVRFICGVWGEIGAGGGTGCWAECGFEKGPHPSRALRDPPSPASGRSEGCSPLPLAGEVAEQSDAGEGLS